MDAHCREARDERTEDARARRSERVPSDRVLRDRRSLSGFLAVFIVGETLAYGFRIPNVSPRPGFEVTVDVMALRILAGGSSRYSPVFRHHIGPAQHLGSVRAQAWRVESCVPTHSSCAACFEPVVSPRSQAVRLPVDAGPTNRRLYRLDNVLRQASRDEPMRRGVPSFKPIEPATPNKIRAMLHKERDAEPLC